MTRPRHTYRVVSVPGGYAVEHEERAGGAVRVRRSVDTWAGYAAAFAASFDPRGLRWGAWT